jgi:hypothetical protein
MLTDSFGVIILYGELLIQKSSNDF